RVLAVSPVALEPMAQILLYSAPTADILSQDMFVSRRLTVPLATVQQHGLGYAALVGAAVSIDVITEWNPDNIRWLGNVASVLHDRAVREHGLRRRSPVAASAVPQSRYGQRTAAELALMPEDRWLEHKETYTHDIKTNEKNVELAKVCLDRVFAFWNSDGG